MWLFFVIWRICTLSSEEYVELLLDSSARMSPPNSVFVCRRIAAASQVVWWKPSASRHHRLGGKSQDEEDTLEVREILLVECISGFQALPSISLLSHSHSPPQRLSFDLSLLTLPQPSHRHLHFPFPNPLRDLAATSRVLILLIGLLMAVQDSAKVHVHGCVLYSPQNAKKCGKWLRIQLLE
jgi:hypothetical protein